MTVLSHPKRNDVGERYELSCNRVQAIAIDVTVLLTINAIVKKLRGKECGGTAKFRNRRST